MHDFLLWIWLQTICVKKQAYFASTHIKSKRGRNYHYYYLYYQYYYFYNYCAVSQVSSMTCCLSHSPSQQCLSWHPREWSTSGSWSPPSSSSPRLRQPWPAWPGSWCPPSPEPGNPPPLLENTRYISTKVLQCVFLIKLLINEIFFWCAYLIPLGWSRQTLAAFWRWPLHASLTAALSPSHTASSSSPLWDLPCSAETLTGSALPVPRQDKTEGQAERKVTRTRHHVHISDWLLFEASWWDITTERACGCYPAEILEWRAHHEDLIHHRAVARIHLHHLVQMRADTRHLQSVGLSEPRWWVSRFVVSVCAACVCAQPVNCEYLRIGSSAVFMLRWRGPAITPRQ